MGILIIVLVIIVAVAVFKSYKEKKYNELETEVLELLGLPSWNIIKNIDEQITVKSRQALENYNDIKFFKENSEKLKHVETTIKRKTEVSNILREFLEENAYKNHPQYNRLVNQITTILGYAGAYRININYISTAGNNLDEKIITLTQYDTNKFRSDPTLLMGKGEYNRYLKEQQKMALNEKHNEYYERVNKIIDYANTHRDSLIAKESKVQLDSLIAQLFDRTVNNIKKIKSTDSEEWQLIGDFISHIRRNVYKIISNNKKILDYYDSPEFFKIKESCEVLMSTQREFNEYIKEKVESISLLFGTRVVRNETINEDEYQYIRPYRKTITPFTAEVSSTVFASAENNPLEYVIKYFYPDKRLYPEQIQKLHLLIEELATLKEAKVIIENHKLEYQQYIGDVPAYIIDNDKAGFYSRLGFANIDEDVLAVEYKFAYTSNGGMAKRTFTVTMTEENIVELIKTLESKLTTSAFTKVQRSMMTKKLREFIKHRDNYTCCTCGNSTEAEPNLLLEIDHIIPISKGGYTVEENLQTLCWKCNRSKSNKIQVF